MAASEEKLKEIIERGVRAGFDIMPFVQLGFQNTQLDEIVRGLKAGVSPDTYNDPSKPVRELWQFRQAAMQQCDAQQIVLPEDPDELPQTDVDIAPCVSSSVPSPENTVSPVGIFYALGDIRLKSGANENYADVGGCRAGSTIRIVEAFNNGWLKTDTGAFVAQCVLTRIKPAKEIVSPAITIEKQPAMNVAQLHQIYLAQTAHLNISLFALPEYTASQMHELRLGLLSSVNASAYADKAIPADQMREIRIAMQAGFSPNTNNIRDELLLFYMQRVADRYGVSLTIFRGMLVSNDQAEEICRARKAGIGEEIKMILNNKYTASQMREIWLGILHNVDVSGYAEDIFSADQMREVRLEQEKALGKKKIFLHRAEVVKASWSSAIQRRKSNIVSVAVDNEIDRPQLSDEDLVFVNIPGLSADQADMLMFALASTKDEKARLLTRPEAIYRVLQKVKNKLSAEEYEQLKVRLGVN